MSDQDSHPHKTDKNVVLCVVIFTPGLHLTQVFVLLGRSGARLSHSSCYREEPLRTGRHRTGPEGALLWLCNRAVSSALAAASV